MLLVAKLWISLDFPSGSIFLPAVVVLAGFVCAMASGLGSLTFSRAALLPLDTVVLLGWWQSKSLTGVCWQHAWDSHQSSRYGALCPSLALVMGLWAPFHPQRAPKRNPKAVVLWLEVPLLWLPRLLQLSKNRVS